MNRRPWPIVILAVLQFLSPLIYLGVASVFYHLSFADTARETYSLASNLRRFEIFFLPLILGTLILVTRRIGYFIVLAGSVYLIVRSVVEFQATNQTDPVFPVVLSNLICIGVLLYFVRRKTREIYFNPSVRWWETDPRYVVDLAATVNRIGAAPKPARLKNVALGGAGFELSDTEFLPEEVVDVAFSEGAQRHALKARIVWQRGDDRARFLGVQWAETTPPEELSKIRRLVRALREKRTPTTRQIPPWWEDLKTWIVGRSS